MWRELPTRDPWSRLLTGHMADQAWEAVSAIARDLADQARVSGPRSSLAGPSLAHGLPGAALFFAYLEQARPGQGHGATAADLLERAVTSTAEATLVPALYPGFLGIGWVIEHLRGSLLEPRDDGSCDEIDEALQAHLDRSPWHGTCDLTRGLAGFGVYALAGLPRPAAARCLRLVLDRLETTAETTSDGITWVTPPEMLWQEPDPRFPRGWSNLGVAHGVPGVIGFLAAVCQAGGVRGRARPLLEGAVRWLLGQKLTREGDSCFPSAVGEGVEPTPAPTAWSYGEPGIAAVLLSAARALERGDWEQEALSTALRATRRAFSATGVKDAGLLFGAAGLAHLFRRMHHATGEPFLKDAAVSWYRRTLEMRRPGRAVGGYRAWAGGAPAGPKWRPEAGFLLGGAGIGLALLAAVSSVEPRWDQVLLASVPDTVPLGGVRGGQH